MAELSQDDLPGIRRFLEHLNTARKRVQILPAEHPYVAEAIRELKNDAEALHRERASFTLSIVNDELYADGLFLAEESLKYNDLVTELEERKLTNLTFSENADTAELAAFVALSVAKPESIESDGGIEAALKQRGLAHIATGQFSVAVPGAGERLGGSSEGRAVVPRDVYRAVVQVVVETFFAASNKDTLNVHVVDSMVQLLMQSAVNEKEVALKLHTMKSFTEYTFYHSVNVAILTLLMGAKLRLDERQLQQLGIAALLHDIGKVNVPEEILAKPGRLTDAEFKIMRDHTVEGLKILSEQKGVDELAPIIAAQHHAHYDLSGYPDFKGLGDIHILSHMLTVADVYDALTSDRCYRKAMLPDRAMQIIIEGRGTMFHPLFVRVFVELAGMFPVGTLVQLDTGELGIVVNPNSNDIYRPQIKLVPRPEESDAELEPVDTSEKSPDGAYLRTIVNSVDPAECDVAIPQLL